MLPPDHDRPPEFEPIERLMLLLVAVMLGLWLLSWGLHHALTYLLGAVIPS